MKYLTIDQIKKQCVIDDDFLEDDDYLETLGDTAEELVEQEIDCDLNQVVAANGGEIPKPLQHAMKIIVEYFYNNRGSDDVAQIPEAFFHMCKLYRRYK